VRRQTKGAGKTIHMTSYTRHTERGHLMQSNTNSGIGFGGALAALAKVVTRGPRQVRTLKKS